MPTKVTENIKTSALWWQDTNQLIRQMFYFDCSHMSVRRNQWTTTLWVFGKANGFSTVLCSGLFLFAPCVDKAKASHTVHSDNYRSLTLVTWESVTTAPFVFSTDWHLRRKPSLFVQQGQRLRPDTKPKDAKTSSNKVRIDKFDWQPETTRHPNRLLMSVDGKFHHRLQMAGNEIVEKSHKRED